MATTVLECDEFATVLLDTEGIDAVGASETTAMSLLTLTTLLSSFLIYNSKKVPHKVDLEKMRCFTQLSTSLLAQCGQLISGEAKKAFFPQFLWLLRDVSLKMTDRDGREIEPTPFLHTRVLSTDSGELTDLGKSLVSLFPSLECAKLPVPSIKRDVIRGLVEKQDSLKPAFNAAVDALIQRILQQITPKRAIDGTTAVSGRALAGLVGGAVNRPGAVPDLDQGWQAVVRVQLKEKSYKLVRKYEIEMEEALKGNLPMEEANLLRIHKQTLNSKKADLRDEIISVNPLHSSEEEMQPPLDELERDTVQWSDPDSEGERTVCGGPLYRFTTQNFAASKEFCTLLFEQVVEKSKAKTKIINAVQNSTQLDLYHEIYFVNVEYHRRAVGPAADEVYERELAELNRISEILKRIPSRPEQVEVIGKARDRVKLSWKPPLHNPDSVEDYVVYKKVEVGDWEEVARTPKTKILIKGLTSNKNEFSVRATNTEIESLVKSIKAEMNPSLGKNAARFTGLSCFTLPSAIELAVRDEKEMNGDGMMWRWALCLAMFPVSLLLAPVTAPIGAMVGAVKATKEEIGDLTEE